MNERINTIENEARSKIGIAKGTTEQEIENLIDALIHLDWYKKEGYNIDLSIIEDPAFKELKEEISNEVRGKDLHGDEYEKIMEHFKKRVIELGCDKRIAENNLDNLEKTEKAIQRKEKIINEGLSRLQKIKGFEKFDKHTINLKVISPVGGQYGTKGNIYIKAFKNEEDLENIQIICLHEMFHAGIEDSIIKKYGLEYWENERIVDLASFSIVLILSFI